MQLFQFAGEGVNVLVREFGTLTCRRKRWRATAVQDAGALANDPRISRSVLDCASPLALCLRDAPNDVQNVQRPAALLYGNLRQRFDALEFFPHFLRRNDDGSSRRESALTFLTFSRKNWSGLTSAATSDNYRDSRLSRDAIRGEITADPAGTACRGRERRALDDGGWREGEAGDEQGVFNPPRGELVLHEIEVGRLVVADGVALVFVFTSAFSLQPSTFKMAPSVMDLSHLGNGEKNLGEAKGPRGPSERARASQSRGAISGF
jgi:hypothetical protein